ncbi:MAG: hypothetical protein ACLUSP_00895 [Christensenellales bacterium]
MEKSVMAELGELGMPQAIFKVVFSEFPIEENCEKFVSPKGMDEAEFYLGPNLGQPLKPLVKIISGGELSRLMLALKVVSSGEDDVPTVIFDEIDTGISGKVGQEVAKNSRDFRVRTNSCALRTFRRLPLWRTRISISTNTRTAVRHIREFANSETKSK